MIEHERLAEAFVDLADTLVDDFDVTDFLHRLADSCIEVLSVQAVGLMLADQRGALRAAVSVGEVQELELYEIENSVGPCPESFASGRSVVNVQAPEAARRWPEFHLRTVAAGFGSVHAIPLRLRGDIIGAMNLYTTEERVLDDTEVAVAQALADVATIGLMQERTIRDSTILTEQLQAALNTRVLIEQAKGVLAERTGLSVAAAFDLLRRHARESRLSVSAVATAVIEGNEDTSNWLA